MALARSRQAARRVKDRWKAKQWYQVVAPAAFNSQVISETLADDPAKLQNRTIETTMQDLTGDMKKMHIKLTFRVTDIQDRRAITTYVGHTMTSDYVRRLTRRGNTKIPLVLDLKTKDGSRIRVKPFAITDRRCQTTQAQEIRRVMTEILTETAKKSTLNAFLAEILVGDLNGRIYKEARKIHPLRRVEIAKAEVLTAPTIESDETPIIMPASEEVEAPMDQGEESEVVADDSEE